MSKKINALILAVSLAVVITVAAVAPTFAAQEFPINANDTSKGSHGNVTVSLPVGGGAVAGHPTELVLSAYDYGESMNYADLLILAVWLPAMNSFVPIAVIGDQAPNAQVKGMWNNTAVYLEINGAVIRNNLKTVTDTQLNVWTEGHGATENLVLMANLTVPVQLDFTGLPSSVFGSSYAVPAMTLMFRGIGDSFPHEETLSFPSGISTTSTHVDIPAWVRVGIPAWLGNHALTVDGTIIYGETLTMNLPS